MMQTASTMIALFAGAAALRGSAFRSTCHLVGFA
jgi:hypothetical protein